MGPTAAPTSCPTTSFVLKRASLSMLRVESAVGRTSQLHGTPRLEDDVCLSRSPLATVQSRTHKSQSKAILQEKHVVIKKRGRLLLPLAAPGCRYLPSRLSMSVLPSWRHGTDTL